MNVLIINPIMYTSETKTINRADSIKDTMIYDLCLAFQKLGHNVTLFAAEPFKPKKEEAYPFSIIWGKCAFQKVCLPHRLPYMPELPKYIAANREAIDLIISGEVFSLNSLNAVLTANNKLIIWHELAKHNAMLKKVPSLLWYNFVARLIMRNTCVVGRSEAARTFIRNYCRSTKTEVIDHGVNLEKFQASVDKKDYFVVCSQLIPRKRIDGIIQKFEEYVKNDKGATKLYIIGEGPLREELEAQVQRLGLCDRVIFTGKMTHEQLLPFLAHAKALLVNTEKDNSMISIVEAIAVGTPIITTRVPLNAEYIEKYSLGIVGEWTAEDMAKLSQDNDAYVVNCLEYRKVLSTEAKVNQFLQVYEDYLAHLE